MMSPEIFIDDFERTENSDFLHGVIGRSLIIATRFDAMCTILSMALEIKQGVIGSSLSEEKFDLFADQVVSKYRTLNASIKSLGVPDELYKTLDNAKKARNEIVHSLTKGLDGCIDTKVSNKNFIAEISNLVEIIIDGDIAISSLLSIFNKEKILNISRLNKYKENGNYSHPKKTRNRKKDLTAFLATF
jgi:hypothetical protein